MTIRLRVTIEMEVTAIDLDTTEPTADNIEQGELEEMVDLLRFAIVDPNAKYPSWLDGSAIAVKPTEAKVTEWYRIGKVRRR